MPGPVRLLSIFALCVGLFAPAAAQAGFAPGVDLIVEAEQMSSAIATDAGGNSLIAWSQQPVLGLPDEVKARRLGPDGTLGPVFDLSPGEVGEQPEVAVGPSGRAFVVWRVQPVFAEPADVKGRWVEPDNSLGPLLTLAEGESGKHDPVELKVAVDPAGVATVLWRDQTDGNKIGLRRVGPDSAMTPALSDISGGGGVNDILISALPSGSSLVVWRSSGIEANVVGANLAPGVPYTVTSAPFAGSPALAVDSAGNGLVAWRSQPAGEYEVGGRLLDPTGAPAGPEFPIDPAGAGSISPTIHASADSLGDFLVSWGRRVEVNKDTAFVRRLNAAGAFTGPAQPVSPPGFDNRRPVVALEDAGVGAIAWTADADSSARLEGRTLDAQGVPSTPSQQLFGDNFGSEAVGNAPGAGVAAFLVEYAISGSAQGAVVQRFLVPPGCTDSSATVVQGKPVAVPIACTGPALEGVQVAEQPRHGTVVAFGPLTGLLYTPKPGYDGPDSFAYVALNDGGSSAPARVNLDVNKDTVKPRIKKLRFIRKGKKFRLVLSEPARAVVRVKAVRQSEGRRRIKLIGKATTKKTSRRLTIKVRGKLARKLAAGGRFRAVAIAIDPAKNRSKPKRLSFKLPG